MLDTQPASLAAAHTVATATLGAVFTGMRDAMGEEQQADVQRHPEFWLDTPMQQIYTDLQGSVEGLFRPDGVVLDHDRREIHILELTRGMEATERAWRDKEDGKFAAYHATAQVGMVVGSVERPHPTVSTDIMPQSVGV